MTTPPTDITALADTLSLLRTRMAQILPVPQDAVALRRRIVDPVLDSLGWSVEDPNRVAFAVELDGQVLDYVLKLQGAPLIGVTATTDGQSSVSLKSLAEAGISWHLTTDGHRWTVRSCLEGQVVLDARLNEPNDPQASKVAEELSGLGRDTVIRGSLTRKFRTQTSPGQPLPDVLPASLLPMGHPASTDTAVRRRGIPQGLALEMTPEETEWLDSGSHNTKVLYHAWRRVLARVFPDGLSIRVHARHVTARAQGRIVAAASIDDESLLTWLPVSTDWVPKLDGAADVSGKRHPGSGDVEVRCTTLSDVERLMGPVTDTRQARSRKR